MNEEELVDIFGEEHRKLIKEAFKFLQLQEQYLKFDTSVNETKYIYNIIKDKQFWLLKKIELEVKGWINKQGHDSCWYYPEIFERICEILGIKVELEKPSFPKSEFEEGCKKHTEELYGND